MNRSPATHDVNVLLGDLRQMRDDETEPLVNRSWAQHVLFRFSRGCYKRPDFLAEVGPWVDRL